MMQNFIEKKISSEIKYTGHIINVRCDEVLLSDGKEHFREVVEHPGGVVIVPITNDNKVILLKQWRYPIGQELIELPAGKLNKGEDPFPAAKRELEEETGYVAESWEFLRTITTTPGFCDEKLHIYKATNLTYLQTNFDYGEIIEPFSVDIDQARNMIKNGEIIDAKTIAGLSFILC